MSCEYCEEGRTLFASAEGRACDIDDISVERLCVLGKEGPAKEPYVIGISLYNGDYCYTKDNKKRAGEVCEKCRNEIDYDQVRRRKAKAGEAS